jgi:phosphoribosylformylglycinamidine cyclo-ligase
MKKSAYEEAGVSIDRGNQAVQRIKAMVQRMGVQEIGKFGGFFPLKNDVKKPVLVSSADGVGTKLKVAFLAGVHHTVGRDLVNHCVNDILVYGARPLFFLDYLASGAVDPDIVTAVVSGVLDGCLDNDMILLGGETAEMPGFYQPGEYDIAGFIVGIVGKDSVVDGKGIVAGDLLIGLPSSGLHTNGYSLARQIVFEKLKLEIGSRVNGLEAPIGEELLRVHRSYLKALQPLLAANLIKGMAHITGGGLLENIPRVLPPGSAVVIEKTWPVPPLFTFLVQAGHVSEAERFRVFNMGIGMVLIVDPKRLSRVGALLEKADEKFFLIGQVTDGKGGPRVRIK